MMVELLSLDPSDIICDSACGTAGFLVSAAEYLKEAYANDILMDKKPYDS
jgi:type I restriction enzyme M protein